MRMDGQEESDNVDDVRDGSGGAGGGFGGGGMALGGGRSIGLGGVVLALVASWVLGVNPLTLLGLVEGHGPAQAPTQAQHAPRPASRDPNAPVDPQIRFVKQVLGSTEQVWGEVFLEMGKTYEQPRLKVYRGSLPTACGQGLAAMGPFYCPADHQVYLDLGFFEVMDKRLGAPGQFAQAYVIGHEVGHHVQNLLGISGQVDAARRRSSEAQANAMSVRLELQADCLAGVWAARSQQRQGWRLEPGDVDTALNAAAQIGDDTLQRKSRGEVVPESFTHGSSAQRVAWFQRGVQSGDVGRCNTFAKDAKVR